MGVFEDLANQKPGMHWQHDRHHSMLANPYDPSRDLSPNLPTTSCRGQEQLATCNVFDGVHGGQCGCGAFKSEFDDECSGGLHPSDCCSDKLQLLHQVSPATMGVVVVGAGDDYRGGPLQAVQPCKLLQQDDGPSPVHGLQHRHVQQHHVQQHHRVHHDHRPVVGYGAGSSPEPRPQSPGAQARSSYAYESPPGAQRGMHRPKLDGEPAAAAEVNLCDGCGLKILDRYYLLAVDKRWHATCLQCFQCSRTLATEIKCFYRDGNIYCKSDYQRLYAGVRRCGRCQTAITPSELVMRARDTVFHVPCFSCAVCATVLTKGDQFGMRDGAVFCQHHYLQQQQASSSSPAMLQQSAHQRRSPSSHQQQVTTPAGCGGLAAVQSPYPSSGARAPLESPAPAFFCNGGGSAAAAVATGGGNAVDATAPAPRQKGRPRKRKPKDLLQDAMTANMDMNSSDSYNMEMAFGPGGLSGAGGNGGSGHQRTKRMRTSFKHHQLRTMKSYFHHNHNPDAKDLKQLSQKTGLPKRVLQVWFQNARAKYRRTASKQDGGLGPLQGPASIKPEKSCSESSTGSTGIEAVMFHQHQQQQHHSMQMSPRSYLSSSSPMMECT